MSRNHPDFIRSYLDYAKDDFCPDLFHFWTAISMVAAALERKVWLTVEKEFSLFPNLYLFLVAAPGTGKSVASGRGVNGFLRELENITFISSKVSEAELINQVSKSRREYLCYGEKQYQSAAYFYGSEGSNSMSAAYGDLKPCLTDWYDCNPVWDKGLVKDDGIPTVINKVCFNMLMAVTFSSLGDLIPAKEIEGGFASRPIFIIDKDKTIRRPKWGSITHDDVAEKELLVSDLKAIHQLSGSFSATQSVQETYEAFMPRQQILRQSITSEKMQSFIARKHVNILKLCMVFSASESDSLIIEQRHWDLALTLMNDIEKDLPFIVNFAAARSRNADSNLSVTIAVANLLKGCRGKRANYSMIFNRVSSDGAEPAAVHNGINNMMKAGYVQRIDIKENGKVISTDLLLLRDPDDELRPQVTVEDIIEAEKQAELIQDPLRLTEG